MCDCPRAGPDKAEIQGALRVNDGKTGVITPDRGSVSDSPRAQKPLESRSRAG